MKKYYLLMIVFFISSIVTAQIKISGVITADDEPEGLPFASVIEKGTTNGTTTDIDGSYSLTVNDTSSVIQISFVGYNTQTIKVGNQKTINVLMTSGIEMEAVVVTAMGVNREEKSLGYASQKISGDEAVREGVPNAIAGLDGKFAGVNVTSSSGTPGAAAKIQIRGASSASGSDPLIVIDGIPIDNSVSGSSTEGVDQSNRAVDINPDDIASVTVLKGAAATAVWGSRAQNGVIIYTTKQGQAGKLTGSASASVGLDFVRDLHKMQYEYGQTPGGTDSWGPKLDGSSYTDGTTTYGGKAINSNDEFYQTGVNQNYNVSLAGGTEKINTRGSFGYSNVSGVIPESSFERYSMRLNTRAQLTDALTLTSTANIVNSIADKTQRGSNLSGVTLALYRTPANYDVKGAYENSGGGNVNFHPAYDNPYWSTENIRYDENVFRFIGNIKLEYDFAKEFDMSLNKLALSYNITQDFVNNNTKNYTVEQGSNSAQFTNGYIDDFRTTTSELNHFMFLTGDDNLGEEMTINFLAGFNYRQSKYDNLGVTGTDYLMDDYYNISNSLNRDAYQTTTLINSPAIILDASLGYKNMLYLTLSGRNEWSSALPYANKENHSGYFYPGVSTAFVFTELSDGGKGYGALSFGKARVAWGVTGLMPSAYAGQNTFVRSAGIWDPSIGYTPALNSIGNPLFSTSTTFQDPNLKPERTQEFEIGVDLRFFQDRLSIDATYYDRTTKGGLYYIPTHPSTGYSEMYTNATDIRNRGFELSIGGSPIKKDDFEWGVMLNMNMNRNKVLKINSDIKEFGEQGFSNSVQNYLVEGDAFLVLYGYKWMRDGDGNLEFTSDGSGNYSLPDFDGSKKQKIGDPNPDVVFGLRNFFTYKNWTLNTLMHVRFGGDIWNGTYGRMQALGTAEVTEDREGSVTLEGVDSQTGQAITSTLSKQEYYQFVKGYGADEEQIEKDINWLKLREVSLSYNHKLKDPKLIKNMVFTLSGTNLFTITNYSSGDPETNLSSGSGAGGNALGLDYFNNPSVRSVLASVKLNF